MQGAWPLTRELVLIGGGHTHALVLRAWGMKPLPGVRLTVINPGPTAPYSGMLPGLIAGHYRQQELEIDLVKLARFAGARVIMGRATGIDRVARLVEVPGRATVFYDIASIDIGITTDLPALPGFAEHGVPAKPLDDFARRWEAFVAEVATGRAAPRVLLIGAGVAGVELALAAAHRLGAEAEVMLLEADEAPLRDIGAGARRALLEQLAAQGVTLRTGVRVAEVSATGVTLEGGEFLPGALVIGAAGARPQGWLAETGLDLQDGFIKVGADLRSLTDKRLYAVGDCAHMAHAPRPKAGVFAVRQAPILTRNLRADLSGGNRRDYAPQRDYLKLISTGRKRAVADKLGLRLEGDWLWRWKNRIDRTFMDRFHDLPAMPAPAQPPESAAGFSDLAAGVPCGGCAAKPGAEVLSGGLSGLSAPRRADVKTGPGDDAAIVQVGGADQVLTIDQFRAFTEDPYLLSRIAAVHALGDVWAMGAAPQAALSAIILPRMRDRMQQHMLREITAAAEQVFRDAGADLVGGHSAVGAELAVGYTVTGLLDRPAIGLGGAQPGDALILTKPLGTGIVMAAEMLARADGADVAAALASMQVPQGAAAKVLSPVARAMTDVTGYGLVGHLLTILHASGVGAQLVVDRLPLLPGALSLAKSGIRSSLHDQNARLAQVVTGAEGSAIRVLLADPQTSGGLLAAVPETALADTLHRLHDAGVPARQIGQITDRSGAIVLS